MKNIEVMAITKYARTFHTGSDPQQQPGQPEAAHGSPPHPAVMNPRLCTVTIMLEQQPASSPWHA